jgi:hypothetical protein
MQDYMAQLAHLVSPVCFVLLSVLGDTFFNKNEDSFQAIAPAAKKNKRIANYFYDLPGTFKRRNLYIIPSESKYPLRLLDIEQLQSLHHSPHGRQYIYPSELRASR